MFIGNSSQCVNKVINTLIYVIIYKATEINSLNIAKMESVIDDIRNWMVNDKLKLNDVKTEFLIILVHRNNLLRYPSLVFVSGKQSSVLWQLHGT